MRLLAFRKRLNRKKKGKEKITMKVLLVNGSPHKKGCTYTALCDKQARSNLMWDSAMAENGVLKCGRLTDFQAHQIEHQLGDYTDCNHGQGLAVIQPVYYRHIVKDAQEKFARLGQAVFGVSTGEEAVDALEAFVKECKLPSRLGELKSKVEITPEILRKVADTSNIIKCNPRQLTADEIYEILMECR